MVRATFIGIKVKESTNDSILSPNFLNFSIRSVDFHWDYYISRYNDFLGRSPVCHRRTGTRRTGVLRITIHFLVNPLIREIWKKMYSVHQKHREFKNKYITLCQAYSCSSIIYSGLSVLQISRNGKKFFILILTIIIARFPMQGVK